MTDLRTAAQQALEAMRRAVPTGEITLADWMKANRDLEAALEEPVLNPAPGYCRHCKQYTIEEPLPAEPVQEPVGEVVAIDFSEESGPEAIVTLHQDVELGTMLYTAPPQRKPLSEEEIDSIWDSEKSFADIYAIARAIERAHGIT